MLVFLQIVYGSLYLILCQLSLRKSREKMKNSCPSEADISRHGTLDEGIQFIQKPFSRKDLAIMVRMVLEKTER